MTTSVVAALQVGAVGLAGLLGREDEIRASGAALVVLPEAVLGGYPRREPFADHFRASVTVPGPETRELAGLSARTGASLVVGVIERDGSPLNPASRAARSTNGSAKVTSSKSSC